ncbi:MAG: CHASE2 domain-containing protein [Phormidesmis sp.]
MVESPMTKSSSLSYQASYQVGGSLPLNASSYVKRQADELLYQTVIRGEFCYVLNSRQMGKSSLQVQTIARLRQEGIRCTAIDLTTLGSQHITPEQWYASILHSLIEGFHLDLDFPTWWETVAQVSLTKRMELFLEQVLLNQIKQPVVIFIDEIDSLLSLSFPCDDFFVFLRSCYNKRSENIAYSRLTFVLLGVATPSDFILDKRRTPFNIGRSIDLSGFGNGNVEPLLSGLENYVAHPKETLKEILKWTGGQPFLTQKICQLVVTHAQGKTLEKQGAITLTSRLNSPEVKPIEVKPIEVKPVALNTIECSQDIEPREYDSDELTSEAFNPNVELIVKKHILERWESQDEPEHLRTIRNRLLHNNARAAQLLGLYQRILMDETITVDGSRDQLELRLSGLVVERQGRLHIKNLIYQRIFDFAWVETQLTQLRPYALSLNRWLLSGCQDSAFLLTGLALKEALTWSDQKYLSDVDYRFLNASQEQAQRFIEETLASEVFQREQAQIALKAAREASQILGESRRQARQTNVFSLWRQRLFMGVTMVVLLMVVGLRWAGWLQPLEWAVFDTFVQIQPLPSLSSKVVVVTIDDEDIQTMEQYPFSDEILAEALARLKQQKPRLIGLDIFRDLPVPPGSETLRKIYQTTPNLIGINKVVGTMVEAPPALFDAEQYGFSDQVLDGDGVVRRGLLTVELEDKLHASLSLELALRYLAQEDIKPELQDGFRIQLGKALLSPLTENSGGYRQADTAGYQILLNYHGDGSRFQTYSLRTVLNDELPANALQDRVVLLGFNALTVKDLLLTPYSRSLYGVANPMSGVFVHANIVHQLISAALENRPLMTVWPSAANYGWVVLWVVVGGWLGSQGRQRIWMSVITLPLTCLGLFGISYLLFSKGLWIPVVPPILGLLLSYFSLSIATNRQAETFFLQQTVKTIMKRYKDKPVATKIALEYLKQGEGGRQQQLIESMEAQLRKRLDSRE